jgi:hypothetical protein
VGVLLYDPGFCEATWEGINEKGFLGTDFTDSCIYPN